MATAIAVVFTAIVIVICRLIWGIIKPIFVYVYDSIIHSLMLSGMTEQAAKAVVSSVVVILIILLIISR